MYIVQPEVAESVGSVSLVSFSQENMRLC
jgi:hypothetical protein